MQKSSIDLFKQALNDGLSNKFDSFIKNCDEETFSEKHLVAIRTIIYGKTEKQRTVSPKLKQIIAILVAVAVLLTSCGIIFRNEIRDIIEDISEFFITLTYSSDDVKGTIIENVYEMTYIPEGFNLTKTNISPISVNYVFNNSNDDIISIDQRVLNNSAFYVDNYTIVPEITDYQVYHSNTEDCYYYLWNDGKYAITLNTNIPLSTDTIQLIIEGFIETQ